MKENNKEDSNGLTNRITASTVITGNITSESDFRIDGRLEGDITVTGRLVIGKTAEIQGNVDCDSMDISGKITGNILAKKQLHLKSSASLIGEIEVGKLIIEDGAEFNATCKMKKSKS